MGDQVSLGLLSFGMTTNYEVIVLRNYVLSLADGTNIIYQAPITLANNNVYTVIIFGLSSALTVVPNQDIIVPPQDSNHLFVRFVNSVIGTVVNIYANGQLVTATSVSYQQVTQYIPMNGNQNIDFVVMASTGNVTYTSQSFNLNGGYVGTIFYLGYSSTNSSLVSVQDSTYQFFNMRFMHTSPNIPNVDVILDNGMTMVNVITNVGFFSISKYTGSIPWYPNFVVKIFNHASQTLLLSSNTSNVVNNQVYTFALAGSQQLSMVTIQDNLSAPASSGTTVIRFSHFAVGVPNVDFSLNSQVLAGWSNVGFTQTTQYTSLMLTGQNNRVDVYNASSSTLFLTLPNSNFVGGQIISVVIYANAEATLQGVVSFDQSYTYFQLRFSNAVPLAPVNVLLDGTEVFAQVPFQQTTNFTQQVSGVEVLNLNSNNFNFTQDITFGTGVSSTLVLFGVNNQSFPLQTLIQTEQFTPPTLNAFAKVRVAHFSAFAPMVTVSTNGTSFTATYGQFSTYQQVSQGASEWKIVSGNETVLSQFNFVGGNLYTMFIEGVYPALSVVWNTDYVPPLSFKLRVFHASPDAPAIDALVNTSSAGFNGITFTSTTPYITYPSGFYDVTVQPANQRTPVWSITKTIIGNQSQDYSFFFIGQLSTNVTNNTSTERDLIYFTDDNTLPVNANEIKVRFIHLAPGGPAVSLNANGAQIFSSTVYKQATNYTHLSAQVWLFDLQTVGSDTNLVSQSFDLRVKSSGSAVYTLVAEGVSPNIKLYAYLDAGAGLPDNVSSSAGGLTGVEIGLIVAAVILVVIIAAAVGFVFWKKRHQRVGYSEIDSKAI
jgi:hypothetical protein